MIHWHLIVLFFSFDILDSVGSQEIWKGDPGDDVTVLWNVSMHSFELSYIYQIHIRGNYYETLLSCYTDYSGFGCYYYYHNRVNLTAVPDLETLRQSNETIIELGFTIYNVTYQDTGWYSMTFSYSYFSRDGTLYVFDQPSKPNITGDLNTRIGETVTLNCSSQSQSLPEYYRYLAEFTYTWTVKNPPNNHVINEDLLTISEVVKGNFEAEFSCVVNEVDSELESAMSDTVVLNVEYFEELELFDKLTTKEESNLVACVASCNPPCSYSWYDEHMNKISSEQKIEISNGSRYTCRAGNLVGTESITVPGMTTQNQTKYQETEERIGSNAWKISTIVLIVIVVILAVIACTMIVLYIRKRNAAGTEPRTLERVENSYQDTTFVQTSGGT